MNDVKAPLLKSGGSGQGSQVSQAIAGGRNPQVVCGSLSVHPVSLGAAMHLAGYRALGLNFTYLPFAVQDLESAVRGVRGLGLRGVGVSMPFKEQILPLLDALDPIAAQIGAVNTVVNDAGKLTGYNSDWWGAVRALEEARLEAGLQAARVLLLGAGGAAKAIAWGLRQRGANTTISNRTPEKAAALAQATDARVLPWADLEQARDYDIVINATSMGMSPIGDASPLPAGSLRPGQTVMDIVYKPIRTRFLLDAQQAGAHAIHGGRMLLHQAARQFELYTGRPAPLLAMGAALEEQLGDGSTVGHLGAKGGAKGGA